MAVNLYIWIERNGQAVLVGTIRGEDSDHACFSYDEKYRKDPQSAPISVSLPFQRDSFAPSQTRCFFDGLLPEGYTRKCLADDMRVEADDYTSILALLGNECLGAIQITETTEQPAAEDLQSYYLELSREILTDFAKEGARKSVELVKKSHLSLAGASGKTGLYYDEVKDQWYQPMGTAPSTHIIKQSHVRLKHIVANEQLCLLTAQKMGIDVPNSFILSLNAKTDDSILFATRRYDRVIPEGGRCLNGQPVPLRLHQEDFAQALGIPASRKYERPGAEHLKRMFELLRSNSCDVMGDFMKLWEITIFNCMIGNTDNHIKNLSVLYSPDLKQIRLAPAYDMISTLFYPSSTEEMAILINQKANIRDLTREDFAHEARQVGLGSKMAMKRYDDMVRRFPAALEQARREITAMGFQEANEISKVIVSHYENVFRK